MLQASGVIAEIDPLCVLDFYVHESCQRQGVGKTIFEVSGLAVGTAQFHECRAVCACCTENKYMLAACRSSLATPADSSHSACCS